jgi:hypothetical protein
MARDVALLRLLFELFEQSHRQTPRERPHFAIRP